MRAFSSGKRGWGRVWPFGAGLWDTAGRRLITAGLFTVVLAVPAGRLVRILFTSARTGGGKFESGVCGLARLSSSRRSRAQGGSRLRDCSIVCLIAVSSVMRAMLVLLMRVGGGL